MSSDVDSPTDDVESTTGGPVSLPGALAIVSTILAFLVIGSLVIELDVAVLLFFVAIFTTTVYVFYYGYTWEELLNDGAVPMLSRALGAMLVLLTVGILIGVWMISGTIPYLMYLGLEFLSPGILLAAIVVIMSIAALVTGTSWGAGATFGVALIGIAQGLGVPAGPAAGAIVMGAYFGDKLSPVSDTTILAAAIAEDDLIDHIKSMLYTTVPGYLLGLGVFLVIGFQIGGGSVQTEDVAAILGELEAVFAFSPLLLIPPVVLLVLSYLRYPTIPVLWVSIIVAIPLALYQGYDFVEIAEVMAAGPTIETDIEALNDLLTTGGVELLINVIAVLFFAYLFAGQLEYTGTFDRILVAVRDWFVGRSPGRLVFTTSITGILTALGTGNSYLSEIVPGIMYADSYDDLGISRTVLSRTLEDSGTVVVPIVPWSAAGVYFATILDVPVLTYAPWAILCYVGFLTAWLYAYFGLFLFDAAETPEETEQAAITQ